MNIPCEECICLAICINKKELRCSILLKFLTTFYKNSVYPEWPNLLKDMCVTLRGDWCPVALNSDLYKIQKDRGSNDSFEYR